MQVLLVLSGMSLAAATMCRSPTQHIPRYNPSPPTHQPSTITSTRRLHNRTTMAMIKHLSTSSLTCISSHSRSRRLSRSSTNSRKTSRIKTCMGLSHSMVQALMGSSLHKHKHPLAIRYIAGCSHDIACRGCLVLTNCDIPSMLSWVGSAIKSSGCMCTSSLLRLWQVTDG